MRTCGSTDILAPTFCTRCVRGSILRCTVPHLEAWNVLPHRNSDLQTVRGALARVVFRQSFAKPIRLHAHNRIRVLVKRGSSIEHLQPDRILLDLAGISRKELFTQIGEQRGELWSAHELLRCENRQQLRPLLLPLDRNCACRGHACATFNRRLPLYIFAAEPILVPHFCSQAGLTV